MNVKHGLDLVHQFCPCSYLLLSYRGSRAKVYYKVGKVVLPNPNVAHFRV